MILGALAAVAFAVAFWALATRRSWAGSLLIGLALFDITGEFVAQGRVDIEITLSFIIAVALLALALQRSRTT